ncbi:MAG: MgtC/SapB family protein [Polyangiales bacterium]
MQPDGAFVDLSWAATARVSLRLGAAVLLGGAIGWERELHHRWAGLRTHILVTIGTAAFMLLACEMALRSNTDPIRALQGVVTGIGFLGGGAILKLQHEKRIEGLTTAAGIWSSGAIGLAVGAGWVVLATLLTFLSLAILHVVRKIEASHGFGIDHSERHSRPPS